MPLLLPFFKFNVADWLTSEKIALMEPPQIGAYIMLLAQCWTQESCTLPSDPLILKKLTKWDDQKHGDFTPVLACFVPMKKTDRLTNPRLYQEWREARQRTDLLSESGQRGAAKRWEKKRKPDPLANGHMKTRGKRAITDTDTPTDKHREFAQQLGLNLGPEWGKFKNYCLAHDKRYANFEAAFRNWLANASSMKGIRS